MTQGFGKARYGSGAGIRFFDLKTDRKGGTVSYTYRLFPPMKALINNPKGWAVYYGLHFGYDGIDKFNIGKVKARPFKCIEEKNFKTGMIVKGCPECQRIVSTLAEFEGKVAKAKSDTSFTAQMVSAVEDEVVAWKKKHNCDRKWYLNAMNPQGEFGVLRMSHDVKKLLEAKIQEVKERYHIDPLDPTEGVWFRFTRIGAGIAVQTQVDAETEDTKDASGRIMSSIKMSILAPAQIEQALEECCDLLSVVPVLSEQQIGLLAKCSGDPEDVDAIWAMGEKVPETAAPSQVTPAPVVTPVAATPPAAVAPPVAPVEAPAAQPAPPAPEDPLATGLRAAGVPEAMIAGVLASMSAPVPVPEVVSAPPAPLAPVKAAPEVGLPKDKFFEMFRSK